MKFCVYVHKDVNGNVFYVGQGTSVRAKRLSSKTYIDSSKSKEYLEKIKQLDFNFTSEIIFSNLTKENAECLEKEVYDAMSKIFTLTNKNRPASVKPMEYYYFNSALYYDPTSPSYLRWKTDRRTGKNSNMVIAKKDATAGTLNSTGYYIVSIDKSLFLAHRIVYLLNTGHIDQDMVIDHKDRDRTNNSIENLRAVTQRANTLNSSIRSDSSTDIAGVSFCFKRNRYRAYVTGTNGKQISRSFSCKVYGKEKALQLAILARE